MKLSDEQEAAVETLVTCRKDVQTLGGYAGSGKTTLIAELLNRLPHFACCAYTGKAAQVLRSKGIEGASTIHSLIYRVVESDDESGEVTFERKSQHELFVDGIVVDEASMVNRNIYDDLVKFGVPLIFVGDHGQLEPVGGEDFNLMAAPDIRLETIHRNAGEIARFANHLREGGEATDWTENGGQVVLMDGNDLAQSDDVTAADQIICAYNKTRVQMNDVVREHLGRSGEPQVGDKVMCLQNDRKLGVFNGMQGTITRLHNGHLSFDCGWCRVGGIPYLRKGFRSEKKAPYVGGLIPFDYAYCVTGHKSQGAEWDSVLVLEQQCDLWSMARWRYTVASRAKKRLTWVLQ